MTRSEHGSTFLQTNLFLDYLFRKKESKEVPTRLHYDVKLVSYDWSSGSLGSLVRGKFNNRAEYLLFFGHLLTVAKKCKSVGENAAPGIRAVARS